MQATCELVLPGLFAVADRSICTMADSSDPTLFTSRAQKGMGASAVDGVCMITKSKVKWQPNDPSKGQPAIIDIGAITSECGTRLPPLRRRHCRRCCCRAACQHCQPLRLPFACQSRS